MICEIFYTNNGQAPQECKSAYAEIRGKGKQGLVYGCALIGERQNKKRSLPWACFSLLTHKMAMSYHLVPENGPSQNTARVSLQFAFEETRRAISGHETMARTTNISTTQHPCFCLSQNKSLILESILHLSNCKYVGHIYLKALARNHCL